MKDTMKWLLYSPLIILHICCFYCSSNKMVIKADIDRWKLFRPHLQERSTLYALMYLLIFQPSFRNQYYLRVGTVRVLLKLLLHEVPCSVLETTDIGGGFVLMHGMGTSINGLSRIGSRCSETRSETPMEFRCKKATVPSETRSGKSPCQMAYCAVS